MCVCVIEPKCIALPKETKKDDRGWGQMSSPCPDALGEMGSKRKREEAFTLIGSHLSGNGTINDPTHRVYANDDNSLFYTALGLACQLKIIFDMIRVYTVGYGARR